MLPSVAIIIPTYDRPRQLATCLRSLAEQEYPRDRYEVIVVDDGSPRPLDDVVAPFRSRIRLTLVRQENAGPAAARNTGAGRTEAEYLAFTDDDCVPDAGWLQVLAAVWAESPDCMVGGRTLNGAASLSSATSQLIVDVVYRHYNVDPARARFIASNNMGLPARAFWAIGGFDPAFRTAEDRDLCDRWLHRGYRIIYTPRALVHHVRPMNVMAFCRQHFQYGRGAEQFCRRRAERGAGHFLMESRFHLEIGNWLWFPLSTVSGAQRPRVAALLALWQLANFAGFVWAALQRGVRGVDEA